MIAWYCSPTLKSGSQIRTLGESLMLKTNRLRQVAKYRLHHRQLGRRPKQRIFG